MLRGSSLNPHNLKRGVGQDSPRNSPRRLHRRLSRPFRPPPIRTSASFGDASSGSDNDSPASRLGGSGRAGGVGLALNPSPRGGRARAAAGSGRCIVRGGGCALAREMSCVLPRVFVGSAVAAGSRKLLSAHGVTHVLNCCTLSNEHEGKPGAPSYLKLHLSDSPADLPRLGLALALGVAFIHDALSAGGVVLVHCHAGISRSCCLAIAYAVWRQRGGVSSEDAFDIVRKARPQCDPNLGYLCALKDWEKAVQEGTVEPPSPTAPTTPPLVRRSRSLVAGRTISVAMRSLRVSRAEAAISTRADAAGQLLRPPAFPRTLERAVSF